MELQKALMFLEHFSVITIGDDKVPNFLWKEQQSVKLSIDQFTKNITNQTTKGIGIVTGFDFLEVIDIDTKVFSTQIEKDEFWNEFIQTLRDNIIDFDEKFVIYQTKSGGYHILYKSKRVDRNKKISVLKGHKEALIESRGVGGYIFVYPEKKVSKRSYFDVDFITDSDRDVLWQICKSYNYIIEQPVEPKKDKKVYSEKDVTPWDEFNNKTDIWDVIQDDFFIPPRGQKTKHYLIKRHNSESAHSGYVFKDSGCMYLFSTGTIYPAEKLISPFLAYAFKYHNGDVKEASKDLYEQGFGTRLKKKVDELKPVIKEVVTIDSAEFPIDIFPNDIQHYLLECKNKLDSNLDFMGVSMLWLISVCVGNSFNIEVKRGWKENGVVWIAVVGRAGIGKTPSIENVVFPLMKLNSREIKRFIQEYEKFEHYQSLTKKEKEEYPEVFKPKKTQFIANDITLEALVEMHQDNDNAVGVFKDELAGWLKDMNKYRAGSDLEFWLSCWSGKSVSMNRKTAKSSFVDKPFIPVLGGIQPTIFNSFSTEENKDNGFLDRMLLSFPDAVIENYNENELQDGLIEWYSEKIKQFFDGMKSLTRRNDLGEITPITCRFSPDAKKEWVRIFNRISTVQNDENENEYLKSMYPKQKAYIPRFALLLNIFNSFFYDSISAFEINTDSILKAEKLSDYFVKNARKIKYDNAEYTELKKIAKKQEKVSDKLKAIYQENPDFNRSKVAEMLGISRRYIIQLIKNFDNETS